MKTRPTGQCVRAFIDSIDDSAKRRDCESLSTLMAETTGCGPRMWGESIVGFGSYHYRYSSGREGDWFLTGFAPRKRELAIYIMPGFSQYGDLMAQLGRHKTGKSCLYVRRLDDIQMTVLRELIERSVYYMRKTYG